MSDTVKMITKIFICFFVFAYVHGASVERRQPAAVGDSCPLFCTDEWMPVCGSDGKTYGNHCEFHIAHCKNPHLKIVAETSCSA